MMVVVIFLFIILGNCNDDTAIEIEGRTRMLFVQYRYRYHTIDKILHLSIFFFFHFPSVRPSTGDHQESGQSQAWIWNFEFSRVASSHHPQHHHYSNTSTLQMLSRQPEPPQWWRLHRWTRLISIRLLSENRRVLMKTEEMTVWFRCDAMQIHVPTASPKMDPIYLHISRTTIATAMGVSPFRWSYFN